MRLSPQYARAAIHDLGTSPGFDATFAATLTRHYRSAAPIGAPVTVAFGSRDRLLPRTARRVDQLPPGAREEALPGCGHLPVADDPGAVAALIMRSAARAGGWVSGRISPPRLLR